MGSVEHPRHRPTVLVSQDRQLWTIAGASPHMDDGKGWNRVRQQAAESQLSLQMETVLHASASTPTERTLLKAAPGSQDIGWYLYRFSLLFRYSPFASLGCPLFHLKEKVWFSVSRLLYEQSQGNCTLLHPLWAAGDTRNSSPVSELPFLIREGS